MTTFTKITCAVAIAATALGSFGVAANAGDWNRGHGNGYGSGYGQPRAYHAPAPQRYYGHSGYEQRDRRGERIATGVAIGVGAIILGSILASQNQRNNNGYQGY
ncbi:unnamed protein product [Phaeothamnion confervicola]